MVLIINSECNRNCSYCFEGDFTSTKQQMSQGDVARLLEWDNGISTAFEIMGGEPTLHPQIDNIISMCSRQGDVFVTTNGTTSPSIFEKISKHNINFIFNINCIDLYTEKQEKNLYQNIEYLSKLEHITIKFSVTISRIGTDYSRLFSLVSKYRESNLIGVRIGISSPGKDFENEFPKKFSINYGEEYYNLVKALHEINPRLILENECAINLCLMDINRYEELKSVVHELYLICTNKASCCVYPDFHASTCAAAEGIKELRVDNVFNFRNIAHVVYYLKEQERKMRMKLSSQCKHGNCTKLLCKGPCIIYDYYLRGKDG